MISREISTANRYDNPRQRGIPRLLEKIITAHFIIFVVGISWGFGGQSPGARQFIAAWGALGIVLFIAACWLLAQNNRTEGRRAFRYLWPLLLFNILVSLSATNPNFKEATVGSSTYLVMGDPIPWLPSSARPKLSLTELWQFNGIILSCVNLLLAIPSRSRLRMILFLMSGNAVVLAVFGTFQKLIHADGLWFGLVKSPNPKFFSTFIYHNHWGAFIILNTAICLALLFYFLRRINQRDIWHSPVPMGALLTLLLATSIPLSASRSCTVLIAMFLGAALVHFLIRLIRQRRDRDESAILPVLAIVLAALLATAAIGYLARDVIVQRAQLTSEQLAHIAHEDTLNSRLTLYRDTWLMAKEKPWFGWGLESYAHVFRVFNSQRAQEIWFGQPFYADAHNDWFQALAEVGFVGTTLYALLILIPIWSISWRRMQSLLPRYLLAGGAIVLLYAWLEFPFANPAVMLTFAATFYIAIRYAELDLHDQAGKSSQP